MFKRNTIQLDPSAAGAAATPNFESAMDAIINERQAPAQTGRPVFEKHVECVKHFGHDNLADAFGRKTMKGDDKAIPLNFGAKDVRNLMPEESRKHLLGFKKAVSNLEIQAAFKHRGNPMGLEDLKALPLYAAVAEMAKAYNVSDFSNFLQTVNSRFFFEEYEIPFILGEQFDVIPMDAPTVQVPGDIGHLEGYEETDTATFTAQSTTQDKYTVISRNNVVHSQITEDLLSDSAPKYIEKLRRDLVKGVARAFEKALINGDTTGSPRGASHLDSDTAALALNATFQKAFMGFRRLAYDNSANGAWIDHGGDSASKIMFAKMLQAMGPMGSEKDDLIWLLGSSIENALVTGAIPELFTAFAFGGLASNVTGQVPPVFGIKAVTSQFVREDLNASGVYASGATLTMAALIKKSRFAQYVRQGIRVWAAPSLPSSDVMLMTAKMRHSFGGNPQGAKEKSVIVTYNVATQSV